MPNPVTNPALEALRRNGITAEDAAHAQTLTNLLAAARDMLTALDNIDPEVVNANIDRTLADNLTVTLTEITEHPAWHGVHML